MIAASVVGWKALGRNSAAIPALIGMVLVLLDILVVAFILAIQSAAS